MKKETTLQEASNTLAKATKTLTDKIQDTKEKDNMLLVINSINNELKTVCVTGYPMDIIATLAALATQNAKLKFIIDQTSEVMKTYNELKKATQN